MNDYYLIIGRTVLLYIIVLVGFRLMGKREVGELSIVDLAVFVLIAEVAAFALEDVHKSLWKSILPIILLFVIQMINSVTILKNKRLRDLIEGDPTMIVENGHILEHEMKKQRYNLDDLFQQLREQGIGSVQSIAYAFLEQSGKLSVYLKEDDPFIFPLIVDGYVDERHLRLIKRDLKWLEEQLHESGYYNIEQIFYCSFEQGKLHVQLKTRKN